MVYMERLIEFLQKEVPSNAEDLSVTIAETLDVIKATRNAISSKVTRLLQEGKTEFNLYAEANKELFNLEKYLQEFSKNNQPKYQLLTQETTSEELQQILYKPDYESCKVDETKAYYLDADFSKKRPSGFAFDGKKYDARSWNKMLVMVCEILNDKNPKLFQSFPEDKSMQGRTRKYFTRIKTEYHQKVGGTDIWVLTNNDGSANCRTIMKMFEKFNIPITSMKIFLRADYSLLQGDRDDENVKKK